MSDNQAGDGKSIEEKKREVGQALARQHSDNAAKAFEAEHGVSMEQWKRTKKGQGMPEQSANDTATALAEDALKRKNEEDRQPTEELAAKIEESQSVTRATREERARLSGKTATERGEASDAQPTDRESSLSP